VESFRNFALRALRHFADFSGRSGRTELIAFYLVVGTTRTVLNHGADHYAFGAKLWVEAAVDVVLAWPIAALMVRRLHDTGRSGGWALLALPGLLSSLWRDYVFYYGPSAPQAGAWDYLAAAPGLALLVLLLWNDDPEPNRYGPNPRCDPPEPEAQGLA
jgi:uncharacterized membrane protein YhaH (DUF805 family)